MRLSKFLALAAFALMSMVGTAQATIINFALQGTAGSGLLTGNEPSNPAGGSGGLVGSGIFLDNTIHQLTVNAGWGSSQGFTDLSSASNNSHIHGPTANNNGSGFTQTAGVLFNLTRSSNLATGGVFTSAPITLTTAQETDLLNGKYYVNIHTATNGGGEIRGFLVVTPEPATLSLLGIGSLALLRRSRRRKI